MAIEGWRACARCRGTGIDHVCPDIAVCDRCGGDGLSRVVIDALTTARAAGYAEAVADVVARLMSDADSYANLNTTKPERLPPVVTAIRLAAEQIKDGAHVGAAKKGGG